jgi:hypothetical protein
MQGNKFAVLCMKGISYRLFAGSHATLGGDASPFMLALELSSRTCPM